MIAWRKSSRSSGPDATTCVEVAIVPDDVTPVWVRDSKNPDGGHIPLPRPAFAALLRHVKANEYNP